MLQRNESSTVFGVLVLLLAIAGLSGCSAQKPPTDTITTAEFALQRARQSEAPKYAGDEFTLAQGKLTSAQAAMGNKKYTFARRLGQQAAVDATYAIAKSEADQAVETSLQSSTTKSAVEGAR